MQMPQGSAGAGGNNSTTQFSSSASQALLSKLKIQVAKKTPMQIGNYKLGELIGRGAHGKVYKATDD